MKKFSLLFLTLFVFILAACSDKGDTTTEPQVNEEGKTVIKVVFKDDGPSNPEAVKFYDALEVGLKEDKGLDIEFELVEVAQGSYAEKLNLLLYSGTIPDLIYFQGGDEQIASQGLLEDLTPYIEKSENLKGILQPHNKTRLENYPYLLWVKNIDNKVPVVRTDFLEQTDSGPALVQNPTVENYTAFFEELVAKGLVKNGVTVAGDIAELDFIFNDAFGVTSSWLQQDGAYVYKKVSAAEKNKLAYYSELYSKGLLDNQYLTQAWDTKEDAFYNNQSGVVVGTNGKVVDFYNSRQMQVNGEAATLTVLPPAKGESQGFGATSVTKEARGLAISSQSPNKELVFEVLDYLASPNGLKLDALGYEGIHHTLNGDVIELNDKYYSDWYTRYWEPMNADLGVKVSEDTPLLSAPAKQSQEAVNSFYHEDNNFTIPEDMISQWDAMENLYKEYAADIITGKKSIDAFDEFVTKWYASGGEQLTKYANENIK
ncbi:ABC transporter substrate-binding protein [Solibacillus sp. R5-41]|uniref:extracellular solute-binding protein n=1 Tax=Solibacillus sp. R5-41 TaxID=2048654 RepID=UPI000C129099|nr:extracellular solute-binding protein [Solibacillus sp. R5-41]ATP41416.1 ABC transporter substrate-binding protein [Solibacillus sp. R5-41]